MTPAIEALLSELEQETPATERILAAIPNDKLGWKPHEKIYVHRSPWSSYRKKPY